MRLSQGSGAHSSLSSTSAPSFAPPRSVVALFVRSRPPAFGEAWAWLSCSSAPRFHTAAATLDSVWEQKSTQTGMTEIFTVGSTPVWEDTASPSSYAAPSALFSRQQRVVESQRLPCRLDTLHVWHKTAGAFRFVGYMWDEQ